MTFGAILERSTVLLVRLVVVRLHLLRSVAVGVAGVFRVAPHVASLAGDFPLVAVIQEKDVPGQLGRRPGRRGVTTRAIEAKLTGVNLRILVAGHTLLRCANKHLVNVALLTRHVAVRALQSKDLSMVKVDHAINAVVTVETLFAKDLCVFGHKSRISFGVTGDAINRLGVEAMLSVTVHARSGSFSIPAPVSVQTKAGKTFVVYVIKR